MSIDITIPGKAYEIAEKSRELGVDLRLKLKMGEKRKKGRGYRVFVTLTQDETDTLAKFFGEIDLSKLSVIEGQAVRMATTRFSQASEVKPVQRPKNAGKGSHMRQKTQDAIWEVVSKLVEQRRCRCELRKGMTLEDLMELGAGCTDPHDFKYKVLKIPRNPNMTKQDRIIALNDYSGHICPVLDAYRRALQKLNTTKKEEVEDVD